MFKDIAFFSSALISSNDAFVRYVDVVLTVVVKVVVVERRIESRSPFSHPFLVGLGRGGSF